ncbi:MAG: hypothetical protein QOE97_824 [Pseudonocardiales bacterium]|jgi:hypothetical protein|nr:hypothetical protein [Pseudonocardiales bacterium]
MPPLIADTDDLHHRAARIRGHASAVRELAVQLARQVDAVHWDSPAALVFRAEARAMAAALRHTAERLDGAADALDHHAARVHAEWVAVAGAAHAVTHAGHVALHAVGIA